MNRSTKTEALMWELKARMEQDAHNHYLNFITTDENNQHLTTGKQWFEKLERCIRVEDLINTLTEVLGMTPGQVVAYLIETLRPGIKVLDHNELDRVFSNKWKEE